MKKALIMVLCLSMLISFSFAANRTDKYQAIKEWWEYYNQLQAIYQNEDYKSRHNNAVNKCIANSKKSNVNASIIWGCVFAYN